jgi:nucleoside-diphosphate-sugar epimerase
MRALVTGCAGFIGSHLTESLLADGHHVLGVDCFNDNYGRRAKLSNLAHAQCWDDFEFLPIDLSRGQLQDIVEACDVVFHLAAEPGVRASWNDRFETYVRNNVIATQHLLEAARRWPEKRMVYASSSSVYGQAERLPTSEQVLPRPFSPYGTTKLAAEHLWSMYRENFGVDGVSLRYFSVYGPRQRPDMAFNIFCRAAVSGDPITVFGDGEQTRDFTFVEDVVRGTRAAAARPGLGGVYNIGGGSRLSLRSALDVIEELAGRQLDVRHVEMPKGDVRDTGADTAAAWRDLGFAASTSVHDGLAAQFEWTEGPSSQAARPPDTSAAR